MSIMDNVRNAFSGDYTRAQPQAPVLLGQGTSEVIQDPLLKDLYFGSQGSPGFLNQLQQAGSNLIGQNVPLQQTAGISNLENQALNQAQAGIGSYQPFLNQNQDLLNQAIAQSKRAESLQDPYLTSASGQIGSGLTSLLGSLSEARGLSRGATSGYGTQLGNLAGRSIGAADQFGGQLGGLANRSIGATNQFGNRLGESEGLMRQTLGGYDQGMTNQFYNPFENQVVNQTIQDAIKANEMQNIGQRASDISQGGESAFGSRARLNAAEREEAFGRGLGNTLAGIRAGGFGQAQQLGMGEFQRQQDARRQAATGLSGLAGSRLGSQQNLSNQLLGLSGQQLGSQQNLTNQLSGLAGQQFGAQTGLASSLAGYGQGEEAGRGRFASGTMGIGQQRGANAAGLGQQLAGYGGQLGQLGGYGQQLGQSQRQELMGLGSVNRNIEDTRYQRDFAQQTAQQNRPLSTLSGIAGLMPQYQAGSSQVTGSYGLPVDPLAAGMQGAMSVYGGLYKNAYPGTA